MNCDYQTLKNAYDGSAADNKEKYNFDLHISYHPTPTSTPIREKFVILPKPKNYMDYRNFGNNVSNSMKPKFNTFKTNHFPKVTDVSASTNIFNFRDGPFNSDTQYNNPIYLGPFSARGVPNNSTFYISTEHNPNLHKIGSIGYFDPDLMRANRDTRYFDYELILVDKNYNIIQKKGNDTDLIYIKFDNRQAQMTSTDKIGLIYIVNVKPTSSIPTNISKPESIPADFPKRKLLISFS
jgi:hypothetical protein